MVAVALALNVALCDASAHHFRIDTRMFENSPQINACGRWHCRNGEYPASTHTAIDYSAFGNRNQCLLLFLTQKHSPSGYLGQLILCSYLYVCAMSPLRTNNENSRARARQSQFQLSHHTNWLEVWRDVIRQLHGSFAIVWAQSFKFHASASASDLAPLHHHIHSSFIYIKETVDQVDCSVFSPA